ncbi:MAG: immunoglobulin-like domain-containing protein [Acholeplasmataceae bacterium]
MLRPKNWLKNALILLVAFVFVVGLVACEDPVDQGPETKSIEEVLEGEEDTEVRIRGTVYYVDDNGAYLSDSDLGKIFIPTTELPDDAFEIELQQEVELVGTFTRDEAKPLIEEITDIELVSSAGDMPDAESLSVSELLELDEEAALGSWYRLVELKGHIEVDPVTLQVVFSDDLGDQIAFSDHSNTGALEDMTESRVELSAVLGDFSSFGDEWRLVFAGSEEDITLSPLTVEEVEAWLEDDFADDVPRELLGNFTLPSTHERIDDVSIEWETDLEEVTIEPLEEDETEYDVTIDLPTEDVDGTLTATVSYADEEPFDIVLNVTVKALVPTDLADALASDDALVMFEAVVIGFAATQTESQHTILVQDPSDPMTTITVDYDEIEEGDYGLLTEADPVIGDIVLIAGSYRQEGRPSIVDPFVTELTGTTQDPVYPFDQAVEMDSGSSWEDFPGYNTFVEIVNPYMRYSTSGEPTPTNWIRLGYDADSVGTNFGPDNDKAFAFLIRPFDETMGRTWRETIDIPLVGSDAKEFEGTIYAYTLYLTPTYIQLVIVDEDHFQASDPLTVEHDLIDGMPRIHEEGNLDLPQDHERVDEGIVWESSHPEIVDPQGEVTFPDEATPVTLTANFAIAGVDYELDFEVTVSGITKEVLQVEEALALENDGEVFYVEGLVLNAGYNTAAGLSDIFLQDKTTGNIMIVKNLTELGEDFEIGDLIEFNGSLAISDTDNEAGKKTIVYESNLEVLESDQELLDYRVHATLIDSNEAMHDELSEDNRLIGGIYFFYGEYFINNTTGDYNPGSLNNRFHMDPDAGSIGDIRYGGKNMILNDNGNRPVLGDNWVPEILGIDEDTYVGPNYPGIRYTGGFYAVLKNVSDSYCYWSVLSPDDFVDEQPQDTVQRELEDTVPETISSGDLELPTTHELVDDGIVWESSDELTISPTGEVTYGDSEKEVVLTATYEIDGTPYETEITVTVLVLPTMSVTDVLEQAEDEEFVRVQGIIVGFHWNGSSNVSPTTNGIIIKEAEGNDLLYVDGLYGNYGEEKFVYELGDHVLALGDEVEFTASYSVSTETGFAGRHTLSIQDEATANMAVVDTDQSYSFDLDEAIVIQNDAELEAAAEDLEYGQLYRLEGSFSLGASSSSYSSAVNMRVSYDNSEFSDYNNPVSWADRDQRFSFKFDANEPHLGSDWWESMLGIDEDNYAGTTTDANVYTEDSYVYFFIGSSLPRATGSFGYIQLVILDPSHLSATRIE